MRENRKKNKSYIILIAFMIVLSLLIGCTSNNAEQDITTEGNTPMSVENHEEVELTPEQQAALDNFKKEMDGIVDSSNKTSEVVEEIFTGGYVDVHFLDVGNADSTIIVTPNNYIIIVDAGEKDSAETILNKLEEIGATGIDLIIATTKKDKNIGAIAEVIEKYEFSTILMNGYESKSDTYKELESIVEEQGKEITKAESGTYTEIDGVVIEILSVDADINSENDSSIIMRATYGKDNILFVGDAELVAEDASIKDNSQKLSAQVWKLGNHGSSTSSGHNFMHYVNTKVAIISVGDNNESLPSEDIVNMFTSHNVYVYRTDKQGNIKLQLDGLEGITKQDIETEK